MNESPDTAHVQGSPAGHPERSSAMVDSVLQSLDRAARGEDVASNLLAAMEQIFLHCGQMYCGRIGQKERHNLNVASVSARGAADQILPADFPRSTLNAGIGALAYQVMFWAEKPSVTVGRNPAGVLRIHDDAFLLRKELKKLSDRGAERTEASAH